MGFWIDPLSFLGAPLLFDETKAVVQLRVGEQLITWSFSLAQLLSDLVEVYSGVPTHCAGMQLSKPRLPAEGEI